LLNTDNMKRLLLIIASIGFFGLQAQELAKVNLKKQMEEELSFLTENDTLPQFNQAKDPNGNLTTSPLIRKLLKEADEAFENMWYYEASIHYEEAFARTSGTPAMQSLQKIADSYYYIGDMENASRWYTKLFENYEALLSEDELFKYSHVLKGIGRKENADRILKIIAEKDFDKVSTTPSFLKYKEQILLENLTVNTKYSDFGAIYKPDGKVMYASTLDSGVIKTRRYKWNNQPFLDLYEAKQVSDKGQLSAVDKLAKPINTKYHEASVSFTSDGNTMYFTRNNNKKRKKGKKNINHLKLFVTHFENGEWGEPDELPFNNEEYSTGHPALSTDGTKLYFVSDMPGGYGDTDIYVVNFYENGGYSEPKNLGPKINSDKKEMFPFVTEGKIYFSSDRKSGLGGLDIYQSLIVDGKVEAPKNMGKPFNSNRDDFAFTLKEGGKKGYLASNRKGGKGDDDIYSFRKEEPENKVDNNTIVQGIVIDSITELPLANANVALFDANQLKISEITTDDDGAFKLEKLIAEYEYTLNVVREDYRDAFRKLKTLNNEPMDLVQRMIPKDNEIITYKDNVPKFNTQAVYFDFDKHNIREDAKKELDRLADYLVENGNIKLKIESHTDSRGSDTYNKYLSERRAQSTKDYLLAKGVGADQIISAIGHGEEQLVNDCSNSVRCSREAHQLNRRSEFIFVFD